MCQTDSVVERLEDQGSLLRQFHVQALGSAPLIEAKLQHARVAPQHERVHFPIVLEALRDILSTAHIARFRLTLLPLHLRYALLDIVVLAPSLDKKSIKPEIL